MAAFACALVLFSPNAAADGRVEIRSAESQLVDGVHQASVRVQYQLSSRVEEALANGIALQIALDFEIYRTRRFLPDPREAAVSLTYTLRYNTVTERYTLRNINTGQQISFATIFAALNALGRIDAVPLVDASLLREDADHTVRLRAQVSIADYPLSLKYLLFWRDDWRVASNWYTWPLVR
ncbi:MAG: DUF4390 domain-containing protein [Pseudomonadota bacterium]